MTLIVTYVHVVILHSNLKDFGSIHRDLGTHYCTKGPQLHVQPFQDFSLVMNHDVIQEEEEEEEEEEENRHYFWGMIT